MTDPDAPATAAFRILETALYAHDLDAADAFYGDLLGLARAQRVGTRHVFYRGAGAMLLIFNPDATRKPATTAGPPVPAHGATGPGHVCFAATDTEITAWRARFTAAGIAIDADLRWKNGARSLYVRDPAGNSVEFAEPALWDFPG